MAREAVLYKTAQGSPLEGYFPLKAEGKNMPPASVNVLHSPGEVAMNACRKYYTVVIGAV